MRRRIVTPPEMRRPGNLDSSRLEVGTVVSHQPGTARIDVRLRGAHHRVVRNVMAPIEISFDAGDWVLVARVASESSWVAITKLQNIDQLGLSLSRERERAGMHPPKNFSVDGLPGFLFGRWDTWTGEALAYQVQTNTRARETGSEEGFTFGGSYLYPYSPPGKVFMRVRALRHNPQKDEAYYSAWTPWAGDRVQPGTEEIREQLDRMYSILETVLDRHLTGEV